MTALLAWFISNPTIIGIGAAIIGTIGLAFQQRLAGAKAERNKQAADEAKARDISDAVQNDVGALPAGAVRKEAKTWATD